ncbi:SAM-dependent methyltransferase [Sphingomonas sanxanigenens]|uniref:NodS family protein n=1 Tax=Sphingomonas sanxanigenens DSM 19645 = NX02 TaxID=1123269 RepID=W0AI26_9SPHN|nr:SAM-dependent methyltransferase [Sphingomonas sanxanigenens]AHE55948.1 hypothetical protein NX02_21585 [Sphingomonas sanxanigenens DSM 19645 = NX02]
MTGGGSLDAAYFDGIFAKDDDPWGLASSDYEAAKFAQTRAVLADRRYASAFEVGCAHGVLTAQIVDLCDTLLAVDISHRALALAQQRLGDRAQAVFRTMAFPREAPVGETFDLVILSEVIYYWDTGDLARAADWLRENIAPGGRVILVHYTGATDYPQGGDAAVERLWNAIGRDFGVVRAERHDRYRLDLWARR